MRLIVWVFESPTQSCSAVPVSLRFSETLIAISSTLLSSQTRSHLAWLSNGRSTTSDSTAQIRWHSSLKVEGEFRARERGGGGERRIAREEWVRGGEGQRVHKREEGYCSWHVYFPAHYSSSVIVFITHIIIYTCTCIHYTCKCTWLSVVSSCPVVYTCILYNVHCTWFHFQFLHKPNLLWQTNT